MKILNSIQKRRTYYQIKKEMPVAADEVVRWIEQATELVPDAFNMKSARVIVALGEKQDALWDTIYDAFGGKVAREKIDSFKAGFGTVLYYTDMQTVQTMQAKFPLYASNFPIWAQQANGMLQFSIWSGLRELNVGASLQHYNPIIDDTVAKLFHVPEDWKLIAQMPFGGIVAEPDPKEKEDIAQRVKIMR